MTQLRHEAKKLEGKRVEGGDEDMRKELQRELGHDCDPEYQTAA